MYEGRFYGTLKAEIERIWQLGKYVIFDVDVKGGLKLKKYFKEKALAIFVSVPSVKILEERLRARSTDSEQSLKARIAKFEEEIKFEKDFDKVIINQNLEDALQEAQSLLDNFLEKTYS